MYPRIAYCASTKDFENWFHPMIMNGLAGAGGYKAAVGFGNRSSKAIFKRRTYLNVSLKVHYI
jgi:hypothetical protein